MLGQGLPHPLRHALGVGVQLQAALTAAGAGGAVEADAGMSQLTPQPAGPGVGFVLHDDAAADALPDEQEQEVGMGAALAEQLFPLGARHAVRGQEHRQAGIPLHRPHDGNVPQPKKVGGGEDGAPLGAHRANGGDSHASTGRSRSRRTWRMASRVRRIRAFWSMEAG